MESLTEDKIKKAGLRFLKTYYRQRERSGGGANAARFDVITEGGIIVDAHLSFETPSGKPFQASLEATSALTKEEVVFKRQKTILFWDSLAAASIITAMVFSYSYAFHQFTIDQIGFLPSIGLVALLILVTGFIVAMSIKWKNRYQYIYAIEQFKKYHVDEQWIAIGFDVFPHAEDVNFLELREQCVVNGFGLIEINIEEEAKLLITPSRNEIFGKERAGLAFERRDSASRRGRMAKMTQVWNEKVMGKIRIPGAAQLKRYELSYVRQALFVGFSFLLIGGIFHRELQNQDIIYMDEEEYEKEMIRFSKTTYAELEEYILDSASLDLIIQEEPGYLDYLKNSNDYADEELLSAVADDYPEDTESDLPLLELEAIPDRPFKVIFATENGLQVRYDCERLFNLKGQYFLVLDHLYANPLEAQRRVARLTAADIPVNAFSMSCFAEGDQRYLVYYDLFHNTEKATGQSLSRYRKLLSAKGFSNKNVRTYSIEITH